ncbi:MAG: hypothetical protein ABI686_06445 [Acidobacteriota bacterium]
MKQCPNCQTTYTDDTLKFCLQDGTPLVSSANAQTEMPTVSFTDSETLVSPRQVERLDIPVERSNSQDWEQSRQTQISEFQPEAKKSKTFLIVALTAFVTLLLFGGAVGTWFYLKKDKTAVVQNNNNKGAVNQNIPPKNNLNAEVSPSPEETSPSPTATPKPSPTAVPTVTPAPNFNPEQVQREVSEKIDAWKKATESGNSNAMANNYADTVDYYNKKSVGLDYVRKDKQRAFIKFYNIKMNLSNLRVTPDASGTKATAVFDKEWNFEGDESYSAGKVQTQLQLQKFNGKWLITGEKDLKVYYTE